MLAVEPADGQIVEGVQGDSGEEFVFGADTLLKGKWYYVEPHGRALESNEKALKRLEHEMQMLGMAPLQSGTGGHHTATESAINSADATSTIKEWTIEFQNTLSQAVDLMSWWADFGEEAAVMMNSDFQLGNGLADMQTLLQMRATGDLSRETLYDEGKRRGVLSVTFDPQTEIDRIENEPHLAGPGMPGMGGENMPPMPQDAGDGPPAGMLPN